MSIKAVIFDLDDTLFEHFQFLKIAFSKVCKELKRLGYDNPDCLDKIMKIVKEKGSTYGRIVNDYLKSIGIEPKRELVRKLVNVFYQHRLIILILIQIP